MRSIERHFVAMVLAGASTGCAPAVDTLLARHHYGQAVCATSPSEGGDSAWVEPVRLALERDLEPRFHVQIVSEFELGALVGAEPASRIHRAVVFLRLVYDAHGSELERVSARATLHRRDDEAPLDTVADERGALALLTGENLPQPVTVDPSALDLALHGIAGGVHGAQAVGSEVLHLATLGILPRDALVGSKPVAPRSHTIAPNERDYACRAPLAETLYQRFVSTTAACAHGERCTRWTYHRRPAEPTPLSLEISLDYESSAGIRTCALHGETLRFELPADEPLEQAVAVLFGDRLLSLPELRARGGRSVR